MNIDVHFRETIVTLGGVGTDVLCNLAIARAVDLVEGDRHKIACIPQ
jgi:hypothetical protein